MSLLFSCYMLLDPAKPLAKLMQLTNISTDFRLFLIVLAIGGFACAWVTERRLALWIASILGKVHDHLWPHRRKQRKEYKILSDRMKT